MNDKVCKKYFGNIFIVTICLEFLVCLFCGIFISNSLKNGGVAYAVKDEFEYDTATIGVNKDVESGWYTYNNQNASLYKSNGTTVSETGYFLEMSCNGINSYYADLALVQGDNYKASVSHRGRYGIDTCALIIGKTQSVAPAVNSSKESDQFIKMTSFILSNYALTSKVGLTPNITVYSKTFASNGSFDGHSDEESDFSFTQNETYTEKWTVVLISSDYYAWSNYEYSFTVEESSNYTISLSYVTAGGVDSKGAAVKTSEGNLIQSFLLTDTTTASTVFECDANKLGKKTTRYEKLGANNNSSPFSTSNNQNLWNVTEADKIIEFGYTGYAAYRVSNLSSISAYKGNSFLVSHGVYKSFDIQDDKDYIDITFAQNSHNKQEYRVVVIAGASQITIGTQTYLSQIDRIENYLNTISSGDYKNNSKITLYSSAFGSDGLFVSNLNDAFSFEQDAQHSVKIEVYTLTSSTDWREEKICIDNFGGDYNNGLSVYFGGYGIDGNTSIFLDDISVTFKSVGETFSGNGSSAKPYLIQTTSDFLELRKLTLAGIDFSSKYFKQTCDLDFTDEYVSIVIGESTSFAGKYDGFGFVLKNISMNYSDCYSIDGTRCSLFQTVSGKIYNLAIEDSSFSGFYSAPLAYELVGSGEVLNCYVLNTNVVSNVDNGCASGIILYVKDNSKFENAYYTGTITVKTADYNNGVAGYTSQTSTISNIFTTTTKVLVNQNTDARSFSSCGTKTISELQSDEFITVLNAYTTSEEFLSWTLDSTSNFPKLHITLLDVEIKKLSVKSLDYNESVNWYYDEDSSIYYLFLPNKFNRANLYVSCEISSSDLLNCEIKAYDSSDVLIGSVSNNSASNIFNNDYVKLIITDMYGNHSYIINVMQGGNASLFIDLSEGYSDFERINADTDHKATATGTVVIIDEQGTKTIQTLTQMKGRGNYTWTLSKKPYQLTFENSFSMLGMSTSDTWLLITNYTEGSLSRTATFYRLSQLFGLDFCVEYSVANIYVNGEYNGMYLVTSKVEVSNTRVNISEDDYLLEIDNTVDDYQFTSTSNNKITVKYPSIKSLTTEGQSSKMTEIKTYFSQIESMIYDQSVSYAVLSQYLDMESFANYYWIQELSLNYDAMYGSSYMYTTTVDGQKILHMGPIWDMDNSMNYMSDVKAYLSSYNLLNDTSGATTRRLHWYNQLMARQEFSDLVDSIFIKNYKSILSYSENSDETDSGILGYLGEYHSLINDTALMNYSRWSYSKMKSEKSYWMGGNSYEEAYTNLVSDLKTRIDFYYNEYKELFFKNVKIECSDNNGVDISYTKDASDVYNIALPATSSNNYTISVSIIYADGTEKFVKNLTLTNGVCCENVFITQDPSIEVKTIEGSQKTNGCSIGVFNISVDEAVLENILIENMPTKINYYLGEEFDNTGMLVKAIYSDGTYEYIDTYQITYNAFVVGENTIDISYGRKTQSIVVNAGYIVINWLDENDNLKYTQNLVYGQTPSYAGESLEKEGYNLSWSPDIDVATKSQDFKAVYTKKSYSVKFYNGTDLLQDLEVQHGLDAVYSLETPTKQSTEQYTYTFDKWVTELGGDEESILTAVTSDITTYASYTSVLNKYKITWKNYDGTILETDESVEYGTTPSYDGETPTKAGTVQYTYIFAGWAPNISVVTCERIYEAQFVETVNKYVVTFRDYDERIISYAYLDYGATVSVPENPTRSADNTYTYEFKSWDNVVTTVSGDATYKATYTQTYINYTVSFNDYNGSELSSETYHYGDAVVAPTTPTRASDDTYTYTFASWNKEVVDCCGSETYTATYTSTYIDYTIKFVNYDDTEISSDSYHYGATVSVPENPTRSNTAQYTYIFAGWTPSISSVTGDKVYKAQFNEMVNRYAVIFKDYDESIISYMYLDYGSAIEKPKQPTRQSTEQYTYTFDKWVTELGGDEESILTVVTSDITAYASYREIVKEKTTLEDADNNIKLIFNNDNNSQFSLVVTIENDECRDIIGNVYNGIENLCAYKIQLVDENNAVLSNLQSNAKIQLKMPENIKKENLVVYDVENHCELFYQCSDDTITFEVSSLGLIAVLNKESANNNSENNNVLDFAITKYILIAICGILLVFSIVLLVVLIKKSRKIKKN